MHAREHTLLVHVRCWRAAHPQPGCNAVIGIGGVPPEIPLEEHPVILIVLDLAPLDHCLIVRVPSVILMQVYHQSKMRSEHMPTFVTKKSKPKMTLRSRCTTSLGSCRLGSGPAGSVLPSSYGMHAQCVGMLCCIMHDTQPLAAEEKHTALGLPSEGSSALHRGRFLGLRTPLHPPVMHVPRACLLLEHGNSLGELCESFASQWRPRKCPRL